MKNTKTKAKLENVFKFTLLLTVATVLAACPKKRDASLPDDVKNDVYEISLFGNADVNSQYSAERMDVNQNMNTTTSGSKILNIENADTISAEEVNVPARIRFMFQNLPLTNQKTQKFNITFTVDKNNITAYKIAPNVADLNAIEKSIAITATEAQILTKMTKSTKTQLKNLAVDLKTASDDRQQILSGKKAGVVLVPMFKYEIAGYGILERTKNELKEETAVLRLKSTDWSQATHVQIKSTSDARKTIGMDAALVKTLNQLYDEKKLDKQLTTAGALAQDLKIGLKFLDDKTPVVTKLSAGSLYIYEVTTLDKLTDVQRRIYAAGGSGGRVVSCQDVELKSTIQSTDNSCVLISVAAVPVSYKKLELTLTDANGSTSSAVQATDIPRSQSIGLVEIKENSAAEQMEVTGLLDPDSSVKISDLQGEFLFRRTFEDAATSFLGQTGTSGDMNIVKFELEDDRVVVRNQLSLIQYTGQGAKDREEIMSIPAKYYRVTSKDAHGSEFILRFTEETTKDKADYVKLMWTANSIPDSTSPLAFYGAGSCFRATAQNKVTHTDMRLAKDGVLNFSIASSHTVDPSCAASKTVNNYGLSGLSQFTFNLLERISFIRHNNVTDKQWTPNISHIAQESFNYGVFTIADLTNDQSTFTNRDGSEKYMPMIHDLRNGKKMRWYLGGINDKAATTAERRQLLVDSTKQVIEEWNRTFRYALRGTPLERQDDYIELVIEEPGKETGRLGDLDKNYIWLNEIPADNGLLGVAQPAPNPRSGVIESANVIVYTGNTYDSTRAWMKMTEMARQYEKQVDTVKLQVLKEVQQTKNAADSNDMKTVTQNASANKDTVQKTAQRMAQSKTYLKNLVKYFDLDKKKISTTIQGLAMQSSKEATKRVLNKNNFSEVQSQGKIQLPTNSATFSKKLTELASDKNLVGNEKELELRINDLFLNQTELSSEIKSLLTKRQQMLALAVNFERSTKNRPGCFQYSRGEINDAALPSDMDASGKPLSKEDYARQYAAALQKNFKQAVMTTLSHELGHAFGLQHNFRASTDKENFEFPGEQTGRNYSSVMDYMLDIEQHYAGPGPYDAHAIRAAYTGYVELSDESQKDMQTMQAISSSGIKLVEVKSVVPKLASQKLIHMNDVQQLIGKNSFVHFRKDTLNTAGIIKFYEQCNDMGTYDSIMCNRFDLGTTATEIVKNKIQDYNRSYINRGYVYDRIQFNWPQKIELITRNIRLFSEIRAFLDETIKTAFYGAGRPKAVTDKIIQDQIEATLTGYRFFHELIRTPDSGTSFSDTDKRFLAYPYQYEVEEKDAQGKSTGKTITKNDIKIIERRSLYDLSMTRDKMDTIGINYDKLFAMNFLMQTTSAFANDDRRVGFISYKDFEQFFLGITDPRESLTIGTVLDILAENLQSGFFDPNGEFVSINLPVDSSRFMGVQTALAATVGLNESKWKTFDPFAESFKVGRAFVGQAPQDRLTVTRLGQDKSKSDTTVYYAPQNATAAYVLIRLAARADVLIQNKSSLHKMFANMLAADLANQKEKGDTAAQKLVEKMRELNKLEAIMPVQQDQADSKFNFVVQVDAVRKMLLAQVSLFSGLKSDLEAAPLSQIDSTVQTVLTKVKAAKEENDKLSAVPLIAYAQNFLIEQAKLQKIVLQTKEEIPGDVIMSRMMDGSKLITDYEKIIDSLEQLSQFSRMVDSDLLITK